jgi:hypothetical protein
MRDVTIVDTPTPTRRCTRESNENAGEARAAGAHPQKLALATVVSATANTPAILHARMDSGGAAAAEAEGDVRSLMALRSSDGVAALGEMWLIVLSSVRRAESKDAETHPSDRLYGPSFHRNNLFADGKFQNGPCTM